MDVKGVSPEKFLKWKQHRRTTVIGYLIAGTMIGIDYSFIMTTLYLYLEQMVRVDNPRLFYGITYAVYGISSGICGMVCGRWVDKSRKVKVFTEIVLLLQIVGCILYVIHLNIAYPLIGRAIAGLGDSFPSIASGELVRIYDKDESAQALFWLASVYSLGFLVGPFLVLFVKNVDFHIGQLHFNQLNVTALLMTALLLVSLIVSHFLLYDCSAEIDLKELLKHQSQDFKEEPSNELEVSETTCLITKIKCEDESTINDGSVHIIQHRSIKTVLKTLLYDKDAALMYVTTFIYMYCFFSSDILFPLLNIDILGWSLTTLTWFLVSHSIVYFIVLMLMSKFCTTCRRVYHTSLLCMVATIIMLFTMVLIKVLPRDKTRDVLLMILLELSFTFAWIVEEVHMRYMLAKMVPSHCQSFAEGTRNVLSRAGTIVASITAPLMLPFLEWWGAGLMFLTGIIFVIFIARRNYLSYIKEIDM